MTLDAESMITCAFEPPKPNELRLILSVHDVGQVTGSTGTTSLPDSNGIFGLGFENLMLGGIVRFSRARTHFIKDARPDAPSE
jgi:hypothetical protein